MYLPPAFQEDRIDVKHGLINAYPLGLLITGGAAGPAADLIPFMLYPAEGAHGVLRAHVARANPVWRTIASAGPCLIVFQGPQEYISPSWYETKRLNHQVVPTWNYATVHVGGQAHVVDDSAWLRRQLDDLTAAQEGRLPAPWRLADAPADFVAAAMKGIIVSQNRSAEDRQGVADGLLARQPPASAMAALVGQRGASAE